MDQNFINYVIGKFGEFTLCGVAELFIFDENKTDAALFISHVM